MNIWKYLLPFDRFVIECDMEPGEVLGRIEAQTTAMPWFRWNPSDVPLEGEVHADGFRVSTATEPVSFFDITRTRNFFRPVAVGQIVPEGRFCRIEVHIRPAIVTSASHLLLFAALMLTIGAMQPVDFLFLVLIPGVFYSVSTGGFWLMTPAVKGTLMHVLNGIPV